MLQNFLEVLLPGVEIQKKTEVSMLTLVPNIAN